MHCRTDGRLSVVTAFEVALDVVHNDNGVVHQHAKAKRQSGKRYHVETDAKQTERNNRDEHGKDDRRKNNRWCAHVSQKKHEHKRNTEERENGAFEQRV
jgi:hypothetical protein